MAPGYKDALGMTVTTPSAANVLSRCEGMMIVPFGSAVGKAVCTSGGDGLPG